MNLAIKKRIGASYYVHSLLGLVPVIGFLFTIILLIKALRIRSTKAGKIFLLLVLALLMWQVHCSIKIANGFKNMPPLDGTDQNKIHEQIKNKISSDLNCTQTDSINLNFVNISSTNESIGYSGQVYACHKVYYIRANCINKTDQKCTIAFREATHK